MMAAKVTCTLDQILFFITGLWEFHRHSSASRSFINEWSDWGGKKSRWKILSCYTLAQKSVVHVSWITAVEVSSAKFAWTTMIKYWKISFDKLKWTFFAPVTAQMNAEKKTVLSHSLEQLIFIFYASTLDDTTSFVPSRKEKNKHQWHQGRMKQ